jgi:hypothetical protein
MNTQAMKIIRSGKASFSQQSSVTRTRRSFLTLSIQPRRFSSALLLTGPLTSRAVCANDLDDGGTSFQLATQRGHARRQRIPLVLTVHPSIKTPSNGKGRTVAHRPNLAKRSTCPRNRRASGRLLPRVSANATATPAR